MEETTFQLEVSEDAFSESSDDSTVAEYEVYLNREPEEETYVLQYPLVPKGAADDFLQPTKAEFRRYGQDLKLTIDTKKEGECYEVPEYDEEDKFRFLHLKSSKVVAKDESLLPCYAVGAFDDAAGELHLTPIRQIFTMQPDLSHLDIDKKGDTEESPVDKTPQTLEVFQLKKENVVSAGYRRRSFKFMREEADREGYTELHVSTTEDRKDQGAFPEELRCSQGLDNNNSIGASSQQYLEKLAPLE